MNTSLASAAEDYFKTINPIAARMYADFQDTRQAYDCLWETLSSDEQTQVLNECIIKPEVTLQYSLKHIATPDKARNVYGQKQVVDENVSYRDEHSAPWSFKTTSQVDLRLFETGTSKKTHVAPRKELPVIKVSLSAFYGVFGSSKVFLIPFRRLEI